MDDHEKFDMDEALADMQRAAAESDYRLALECVACGREGMYDVLSVSVNPEYVEAIIQAAPEDLERLPKLLESNVYFSGLFRCKSCGSPGPWRLTQQAFKTITLSLAMECAGGPAPIPILPEVYATPDGVRMQCAAQAEKHLKALIEEKPDYAFCWLKLGELYTNADKPGPAKEAYQRALELDPSDFLSHMHLGGIYEDDGELGKAAEHLHEVMRLVRNRKDVSIEERFHAVYASFVGMINITAESDGEISLLPPDLEEALEKQSKGRKRKEKGKKKKEPVSQSNDLISVMGRLMGEPRKKLKEFEQILDEQRLLRKAWDETVCGEAGDGEELDEMVTRDPLTGMFHERVDEKGKPDNIIHIRGGRKIKPTDPCPCGSGKKYKKCCGLKDRGPGT